MILAHKIALDPNEAQRRYFTQGCGVARFAYNWALAEWQRQYRDGGKPNALAVKAKLNGIKRERFPWMYDVARSAAQEAVLDLGAAFQAFFRGRGRYPKFKSRDGRASFCAAICPSEIITKGLSIRLPVVGWVRMREAVRFSGTMKRATVSLEDGRWFVSVMVETDDIRPTPHPEPVVGVDLGVSALATLSTGETISGPKAHKAALGRLRRLNRSLSRKRNGSANRRKAKAKIARLHRRIADRRRDATHKLTTRLTKTYAVIGIEDLNVRGMVRNRHLARAIIDQGFGEFRRQIDYKARMYGAQVVVAGRFYPSSKTCSCCGVVKPTLALAERVFRCGDCGHEADRDINAAINLMNLAASSAVSACGAEGAGARRKPRVKPAAMKQEETTGEAA